jgi:hypothetical protein
MVHLGVAAQVEKKEMKAVHRTLAASAYFQAVATWFS